MRKSNVLRGLTSVTAAVLAFAVVMTNTAMGYASMLNTSLGTATGKFVDKSGEEPPVYYASDYGDVNNLTQEDLEKLQADEEAFIEEEMEEGAVLLRNQENTLPLAEDERNITLFGYTSAHPLYKNSSGGGNNDPTRQVSLYDALKEKGFNINDTLYNAYLPEDPSFANVGSIGGPSVAEKPIDFYTDDLKSSFADYSDVAVVVLARYGGENTDVSTQDAEGISGLALHKNEADMLKMIKDSGQFDKIRLRHGKHILGAVLIGFVPSEFRGGIASVENDGIGWIADRGGLPFERKVCEVFVYEFQTVAVRWIGQVLYCGEFSVLIFHLHLAAVHQQSSGRDDGHHIYKMFHYRSRLSDVVNNVRRMIHIPVHVQCDVHCGSVDAVSELVRVLPSVSGVDVFIDVEI